MNNNSDLSTDPTSNNQISSHAESNSANFSAHNPNDLFNSIEQPDQSIPRDNSAIIEMVKNHIDPDLLPEQNVIQQEHELIDDSHDQNQQDFNQVYAQLDDFKDSTNYKQHNEKSIYHSLLVRQPHDSSQDQNSRNLQNNKTQPIPQIHHQTSNYQSQPKQVPNKQPVQPNRIHSQQLDPSSSFKSPAEISFDSFISQLEAIKKLIQQIQQIAQNRFDQRQQKHPDQTIQTSSIFHEQNQYLQKLTKHIKDQLDPIIKSLKKQIHFEPPQYNLTLFSNSKIIKNQSDERNLLKMFPKKLISASLLYRASQQKFLASRFHNLCDNKPDTLIICQIKGGNIVGGYTPLCWNFQGRYSLEDQTGTSFIFSLNQNHKFTLRKPQDGKSPTNKQKKIYAITPDQDGISFGCEKGEFLFDFQIRGYNQKTGDPTKSSVNPNMSYYNENYKSESEDKKDRKPHAKFIGIPPQENQLKPYQFYPKEWEVWQLTFSEKIN